MSSVELEVIGPGEEDWLSPEEVSALTPALLRERILALKPVIGSHARKTEDARRPLGEVWRSLRRTGVFYHFMPKLYGGLEFSVSDFISEMLPIGEVCASMCWVTAFTMEHNWLAALFPAPVQDELFRGGRYIVAPGVSNPPGRCRRVEGGYRLSGRWRFGSAVMNANWVMALALLYGDDTPEPYWFIFPIERARVLDTWYMDGLAGTGSNDVEVEDAFIPTDFAMSMADIARGAAPGTRLHENPLYRMPAVPFLSLTTALPTVGAARGAVNLFRETLLTRCTYGSRSPLAEKASAQVRLAHADLLASTAETLLRQAGDQLTEIAAVGDGANAGRRIALTAQIAFTTKTARDAIRLVAESSGASAHALDNPLQRIVRDSNMATSHLMHDFDLFAEQHGRSLLGVALTSAPF
jgi:alkylation response protein AidB-like acyl-CoA dehydrogenase